MQASKIPHYLNDVWIGMIMLCTNLLPTCSVHSIWYIDLRRWVDDSLEYSLVRNDMLNFHIKQTLIMTADTQIRISHSRIFSSRTIFFFHRPLNLKNRNQQLYAESVGLLTYWHHDHTRWTTGRSRCLWWTNVVYIMWLFSKPFPKLWLLFLWNTIDKLLP